MHNFRDTKNYVETGCDQRRAWTADFSWMLKTKINVTAFQLLIVDNNLTHMNENVVTKCQSSV